MQALAVVDLGAHQVLQAERIDQQGDVVSDDGQIVLALLLIELESVLEARAAATLDVDAQLERRVAFLGDQHPHLGGGGGAEFERALQRLIVGRGGGSGEFHGLRMGRWRL